MEQAVNQFNKGLLSDTHPMVQGNDTLSDALNATFVTMNGNEVVLQNDMGNRRVDNAYLPSGYEPVGMKEYGGIIYVAAYNPITNKSLLGSFPSPERKISSEDGSGLGGKLELDLLLQSYNDANLNGLKCIYKDTILVPLTKDTSLHAGDKFVVYGTLTDTGDISNYHNTTGTKVTSPKNKKYTLALGILNSLNEFVDITKTLTRWNGGTMIDYTDLNVSDLFKFNNGYFIASLFENPTFYETLSDAQLIIERLTIATNTYAYKLVGPLYVKATLNHIRDFNYNIYGISSNDEKTKGEIWIEAFVTYNCPDGLTSGGGSDDNYSTYAEGKPSFPVFDLKDVSGTRSLKGVVSSEKTKYDPNTDLYTYKIVKHYDITAGSGTIYLYVIGVQAVNGEELYLSGLSTKGEIDISLLGSGEVKLKGWRFICDYANLASTITYNFDAYPKYGESFLNFKFIVTDSKDSNDSREIPANLYNGRNNLNIDWKTYGLLPNKLYKITWEYDIVGDSVTPKKSTDNSDTKQQDRWLLTTELFNDCYSPNSGDYILDFGNPSEETSGTTQSEEDVMKRKELVPYVFNPNVVNKTTKEDPTHTGNIISSTSVIEIKYTTKLNIKLLLSPTLEFEENLYPDYIKIKSTASNNVVVDDIVGSTEGVMNYDNNLTPTNPTDNEPKFTVGTPSLGKIKTIIGTLENYDYYKSLGNQQGTITNAFLGFHDYLTKLKNAQTGNRTYSMVVLDFDNRGGGKDDGHVIKVDVNNPLEKRDRLGRDGAANSEYLELITREERDGRILFQMKQHNPTILDKFQAISNEYLFTWGYYNDSDQIRINSTGNRGLGNSADTWARVWWRTSFGDWALFPSLKQLCTSIDTFVKNILTTDFRFACYETLDFSKTDPALYRPTVGKEIQSREYSFPYYINWKMSIAKEEVFDIKNPTGIACRYPEFKVLDQESLDLSETFEISTAEEFLDLMNLIPDLDNLNGFDLTTGKTTDINGNALNPLNLYKVVNGELVYWNISDMVVNDEYGPSGMRGVIYNKQTLGLPNNPYDVTGNNGDTHTTLFYNNVNIVRGCK